MREVILFPDVEELLQQHLSAELAARGESASVHTQVPGDRPETFVVVPRTGGTRRNLVEDGATIAFEAWSTRPARALRLCQLVRGLVHALPGRTVEGVPFYRVAEFGGPAHLPDPQSFQSRYVFTAAVGCRGVAA